MSLAFNEYEAMTDLAQDLAADMEREVSRIVDSGLAQGITGRELQAILHPAVDAVISHKVLRRAMDKRRAKIQSAQTLPVLAPSCCRRHQDLGYIDGGFCLGAPIPIKEKA